MLTALLGGALLAERTGAGAPRVLALHGWARTRADLLPVVAGLDALVPDLPGFGASPAPAGAWSTREYAEQLAAVLDGGRWVVVGHSFGGRVAVQLAAGWPDLVSALVLTGVPLLRPATTGRPPAAYRLARRMHGAGLLPASVLERQRRRHGSPDYLAATGVMRETFVRVVNEDYRALLPAVAAPVELVWGAGDTAAPLAVAREAQPLFPAAELTVSASSGHLLDAALVDLLRSRLAVRVP